MMGRGSLAIDRTPPFNHQTTPNLSGVGRARTAASTAKRDSGLDI